VPEGLDDRSSLSPRNLKEEEGAETGGWASEEEEKEFCILAAVWLLLERQREEMCEDEATAIHI